MKTALLCTTFLAGCAAGGGNPLGSRSIVRAVDGGSAMISITACPPSDARAAGLADALGILLQQEDMVVAQDRGSARLILNLCPPGSPVEQSRRR